MNKINPTAMLNGLTDFLCVTLKVRKNVHFDTCTPAVGVVTLRSPIGGETNIVIKEDLSFIVEGADEEEVMKRLEYNGFTV